MYNNICILFSKQLMPFSVKELFLPFLKLSRYKVRQISLKHSVKNTFYYKTLRPKNINFHYYTSYVIKLWNSCKSLNLVNNQKAQHGTETILSNSLFITWMLKISFIYLLKFEVHIYIISYFSYTYLWSTNQGLTKYH